MNKIFFEVKELKERDLEEPESFFETLKNLRSVGNLNAEKAKQILKIINSQNGYIFIAKNNEFGIVGSVSLLIEQKFIREGAKCGHIEDVSTRKGFEGNNISSSIIKKVIEFAKEKNCYKIILDCDDKLINFYSRFGFKIKEKQMRLDL